MNTKIVAKMRQPVGGKTDKNFSQVLEYLSKKGYSRAEATLRIESGVEGGPLPMQPEMENLGLRYMRAFGKSTCIRTKHQSVINSLPPRPNDKLHRGCLRDLQGKIWQRIYRNYACKYSHLLRQT